MKKVILSLLTVLFLGSGVMADMTEHWQEVVERMAKETWRAQVSVDGQHYKLKQESWAELSKCAQKVMVLENPDTRSLPQVAGMAVFYLENNDLLVVQMVSNHWFKAVYFAQGNVVSFILRDHENALLKMIDSSKHSKKSPQKTETETPEKK